eukprot:CAMPEP_0115219004 /NCGR_PEP_ID=MMETSP0270-20121206/26689_1 /TAXON_ID=71861 /ORGANISM="Scrippsiella trochoidea, Strain CCMP3099" /LENGTH=574 /DNA_ID=CAMNT_0002632977 /DNA_START=46 /DNA_END=1770 /DNA_ORIENTATION=-
MAVESTPRARRLIRAVSLATAATAALTGTTGIGRWAFAVPAPRGCPFDSQLQRLGLDAATTPLTDVLGPPGTMGAHAHSSGTSDEFARVTMRSVAVGLMARAMIRAGAVAVGVVAAAAVLRQRRPIASLRRVVRMAHDANATDLLRPVRDSLGGRETSLEEAVKSQQETATELEIKMNELRQTMQAKLAEKRAANSALRNQIRLYEEHLSSVNTGYDELTEEVEKSQAAHHKQVNRLTEEVATSQAKASLQAEAKEKIDKAFRDVEQKLMEAADIHRLESRSIDQLTEDLRKSGEEFESTRDALQSQTASLEKAMAECSQLEEEVKAVEDEKGQLRAELTVAEGQTAELEERVVTVEKQRDHLKDKLAAAESERRQLQEDFDALQGEKGLLAQQVTTMQNDRDELQASICKVQSAKASLQDVLDIEEDKRSEVEASLALLEGKQRMLEEKLASAEQDRDGFAQQLKQTQEKEVALTTRLTVAEENESRIQVEWQALEGERQALAVQRKRTTDLQQTLDELSRYHEENTKLADNLRATEERLARTLKTGLSRLLLSNTGVTRASMGNMDTAMSQS